jgi:hypothetical protein
MPKTHSRPRRKLSRKSLKPKSSASKEESRLPRNFSKSKKAKARNKTSQM